MRQLYVTPVEHLQVSESVLTSVYQSSWDRVVSMLADLQLLLHSRFEGRGSGGGIVTGDTGFHLVLPSSKAFACCRIASRLSLLITVSLVEPEFSWNFSDSFSAD